MTVTDATHAAERLLPGRPAPEGERDERWQAILRVGAFIKDQPEEVWSFAYRWGCSDEEDVRTAIATCLLEHLLEDWFDRFFPRVEQAVRSDPRFADTFSRSWKFGEATDAVHDGDQVSVSYHDIGGAMHAAQVRISAKGAC